jgi:cytochrome c
LDFERGCLKSLKSIGWAVAVVLLMSLAACGNLPTHQSTNAGSSSTPSTPSTTSLTGGILTVRLKNALDPPASIFLSVGMAGTLDKAQFEGKLTRNFLGNFPDRYADYLVVLSLLPNRYVLESLRALVGSKEVNQALSLPFTVVQGSPNYLGRLVLTLNIASEETRVGIEGIENHLEEDTVVFRSALKNLKNIKDFPDISSALIQISPTGVLHGNAPSGLKWATTSAAFSPTLNPSKQVNFELLTPSASSLLASTDRSAFRKFLRVAPPRAFATNHSGAWGWASGVNSVPRALTHCSKRLGPANLKANNNLNVNKCQLFAVDEMLINFNPAAAPMKGEALGVANPAPLPATPQPLALGLDPLLRLGSRAEAQTIADAALDHVQKVGATQAFEDFSNADNGQWRYKDLFVFVFNTEGVYLAHGAHANSIKGNVALYESLKATLALEKPGDTAFINGSWVDHDFSLSHSVFHSQSSAPNGKSSYIRKIPGFDAFVGISVYR